MLFASLIDLIIQFQSSVYQALLVILPRSIDLEWIQIDKSIRFQFGLLADHS